MPAGRPTKYNPKYIDSLKDYLKTTGRLQTELPTMEGFADYLSVDSDTLRAWGDKHPKFLVTIKKLMEKQRKTLMDDGLYGGKEVNSSMAIFLLKANHGFIETERKEITGRDGNELSVKLVSPRQDDTN